MDFSVIHLLALPIIAFALILTAYFILNEWTRYQARLKGLKGPRGLPVIGNLLQVRDT